MISRRASADLDEINDYLATDSISAANSYALAFADKFDLLAEYPRLGLRRGELGPGQRHLIVEPYLILYRVSENEVEILRVVHGRRNLIDL